MSRGPRRITPRNQEPRLSLCMIVKNEAETLEKCLGLARPHVDEIVVVDTGSTDATPEIARRYADVYDEIEWPDSFSLARNHSLDLAGGDFILILDGDEYIEGEADWQAVRAALRQPDLAAAVLPVRNLLGESQIVLADRMWQERILRNDPRLRYTARVHNQIQDAVLAYIKQTGRKYVRVEAEVVHTGYAHAPERMRRKYEPRVRLLETEYREPRSEVYRSYYGFQLGVAYFVLKRFDEALAIFGEIDYALMTSQNAFYAHLLGAQSALKLSDAASALAHCNDMLTLTRAEPIAYFTTGVALLLSGKVADGMLMLLEGFDISEAGGMQIRFVMNPVQMLRTLANTCEKVGLKDHERAFRVLADKPGYRPEVVRALVASLKTGIVMAEYERAA